MLRFLRLSFVAVIAVVCLSIYASHTEAAPLEVSGNFKISGNIFCKVMNVLLRRRQL